MVASAIVAFATLASAQEKPASRMALVIGNADYDLDGRIDASNVASRSAIARGFASDLENPVNDARLVKSELERLGYSVALIENADRNTFLTAVRQFGAQAQAASPDARVIVYFAGHGVRLGGHQMILPVGAKPPDSIVIRFENGTLFPLPLLLPETMIQDYDFAVSYAEISRALGARADSGFNLIVLDVCGNNPYVTLPRENEAAYEYAHTEALPPSSVMMLSAGGRTAADGRDTNSPFAKAFQDVLRADPNVSLYNFLFRVEGRVSIATDGSQIPRFLDNFDPPLLAAKACIAC
jgi:uncharacterized caspase-like protein